MAGRWKFKPHGSDRRSVRVGVQVVADYRLRPAPPSTEFGKDAHREGEAGFLGPIRKQSSYTDYTTTAMAAKIQGEVVIEAVVLEDGTVGDARIQQSLDTKFGLDDAALSAAKRWVFEPATLNGVPARAVVKVIMEFRLH